MSEDCRICAAGVADLVQLDAHAMVIRAPGGLWVAPRRHLPDWRALSEEERQAVAARLAPAQDLAEAEATAPARIRFVETGPHFHVEISAAPLDPPADPPARGPALLDGPEAALLAHLVPHVDEAVEIDAAVAFALRSGVDLLFPYLEELLERGGRLRLLVGDYLGATDPAALRRLMDLPQTADLRVFDAAAVAFHPKSWLFRFRDGTGALLVGSSNLSRSALAGGVEWNLRLFGAPDAPALAEARAAFARLMARPEVAPLTHDWIDAYAARRLPPPPQETGLAPEPPPAAPEPHEIQAEALAALAASRARGHRAGLVVLATGLGKTFLAAFDSRPFARVLFIAHREEILTQAMAAFRAVRPDARLGRFAGAEKDREAEILFASIQTLGRAAHLQGFDPGAFDYVVVDEFHHAAAATYRRVIEHFEPAFLLGLTATPERMDGGDLLALCGENLVHRCDMWDAITRGRLCPFTYHGLPDAIDYTQIPWRGRRFDEAALTAAAATRARARDALDQLAARGGARTLGFCVSQAHADFMARMSREAGLRARAVHSGPTSAPRTASLAALQAGELDVVFAVDMFNEGVDVPEIDTVLMLRPTESPVVWLQQFGRGLRLAEGKARLTVIDYIGAHRAFLVKARALLQTAGGDRALAARLREVRTGELALPPGCEILYETETLDLLEALLRVDGGDAAELEAFYEDVRLTHGARPTAAEIAHAGFDPRRTGHGQWFDYVRDRGDLDPAAERALQGYGGLTREVELREGRVDGLLALAAALDE
ncbi:MAG: DEAD/DEAH box helicase family protein, partial [Albimonas sp.]|uniref:DEAD/DEAH box helicase family protein n=1 Tax=Albimonas sp. TaxID=1872425 RepID=UPI004055CCEF